VSAITRADLIRHVDEGIAHQRRQFRPFTPEQEDALREVARTTPRVAWGMARSADGCGCPLTQAGILLSDNSGFWGTFDDAIQVRFGFPGAGDRVLEVLDA
jgi:hypothetical protein